jgi:pimeloyl-ACP methyl ester carboxylesterase
MTDFRRLTLALPDGEMAAVALGDPARPIDLVFLHANGFNALTYRDLLGPLADRAHIVALDMRGHGLTRLPAGDHEREDWNLYRDDLIAAVQRLQLSKPAVFAGHSMGGTTALMAAPTLGGQVRSLVLLDPVIIRPRFAKAEKPMELVEGARRRRRTFPSKGAALAAYVGRGAFKTWPPEAIADYVEDGFTEAEEGVTLTCAPEWEASNFMAQGSDPWAALDALTRPLTILRAEHGSTCLIREDDGLMQRPDRSVTTVPGTTHFLPIERPDVARAAILAALEG